MFLKVMLFLGLIDVLTYFVSLTVAKGSMRPPGIDINLHYKARTVLGVSCLLGVLWIFIMGIFFIFFNL